MNNYTKSGCLQGKLCKIYHAKKQNTEKWRFSVFYGFHQIFFCRTRKIVRYSRFFQFFRFQKYHIQNVA